MISQCTVMSAQQEAIAVEDVGRRLPSTRFRGSKRRYAAEIAQDLVELDPKLVRDPFGGSASVSCIADALGIKSHYNDLYAWTSTCARTLLVHRYTQGDLDRVQDRVADFMRDARPGFVSREYKDCYFTRAENLELDGLLECLASTKSERLHDLVFYGVSQAALAKMPMSMFHRASLKQRTTKVDRRSGNATIWNTPFRTLVPRYLEEAVLFTWRRRTTHTVTQGDALQRCGKLGSGTALFLDPPYINPGGGVPDYSEAYHFLEGLVQGEKAWASGLQRGGKHPIYDATKSKFEDAEGWTQGVDSILDKVTSGGVVATARERDSPGARKLRELLKQKFSSVKSRRLHTSTIFTSTPNAERLFLAV